MIGKEIRIGNIINSKLLGTNHLVQGFIIKNNKQYLYTDLQESYSDLEDWQSIKPTEEYILKLGFEWYKPLFHYRKVIDDVWYSINFDKENNIWVNATLFMQQWEDVCGVVAIESQT